VTKPKDKQLRIVKGERFTLTPEEKAFLGRLWDRQSENSEYVFTDQPKGQK
jgi:hypothetical protein